MADEKISDLTELVAASIDGSEETVIEKAGANKRVKFSSLASRYGLPPAGALFYNVLLSQSGTGAPTVTRTIQNTLGAIVWTRGGAGAYTGTLTGAFPDQSKVVLNIANSANIGGGLLMLPNIVWNDANSISVLTNEFFAAGGADDLLNFTNITITILP